jgi:polygalacturonase
MKKVTIILGVYFLSMIGLLSMAANAKADYRVTNFGAKGDGKTLNSAAIQKAIDTATGNGGGTVVFPKGVYLSGSIELKSNVCLHLEKGAVLLGSTNPLDYHGLNRWKALILADGQKNIGISGDGTIDGQGLQLALNADSLYHAGLLDDPNYNKRRFRVSEYQRPQIIEMVKCTRVSVTGVRIRNAACWVQTYDLCENLIFDRIDVYSDAFWNNDGLDISDCRNVRITNSVINSADDGICLKSHSPDHANDSIYIANCTVRSSASAIKFGTASFGGFKNIKIENIKVYDTFRSAIALESVDGGTLENIDISGIYAKNTGNAIFIRLGHRNQDGEVGKLRNISIRNVKVEVPARRPDENYILKGPALPFFHNVIPSSITGIPGAYVENVSIEDVEIIYPGGANKGYAYFPLARLPFVPEQIAEYPEFSTFGELPAWALYVRHVKGLSLKNVRLTLKNSDFRPACVFDDVQDMKLENTVIKGHGPHEQIILKEVRNEQIDPQGFSYGVKTMIF